MKKPKFSKKLLAILISLLCISIIVTSVVLVFFQKKYYVSADNMDSYAQAFISNYDQDISAFNQTERKYFYLYSDSGYNVTSFISSSYGAAIMLAPSGSLSFENNDVKQRVEQAVFGGNFTVFPMFEIPTNGHDIIIEAIGAGKGNGTVETNGHPLLELGHNSSVIIESVTVDSVFYPCILLKANNETNGWNAETAKDDARQVFESDLIYALGNSEEVREVYAYPVLQALIQNVVDKWRNSQQTQNYTLFQKIDDLENIKEIAQKQYGIVNSNDLINNILTYVQGQITPPAPPPKTVFFISVGDDQGNWRYVIGWCFLPLFAYIFYLSRQYFRNRFHSKELNFLYGVMYGGFLIPCFTSLLVNYPYDYVFFSWQTLVIVIVVVVGLFIIRKGKNRFLTVLNRLRPVHG